MKRTELKRTGMKQKKRRSMRRSSPTNSKPHEDLKVRKEYRDSHPNCLLCGDTTHEIHHIRRGCLRVDHPANLAALCWGCHTRVHDAKSVYAPMTIEILYRKLLMKEFDRVALDAIGKPFIAGWLAQHRPGAVSAALSHAWFRLTEECGKADS